jgi:hypothetical protein
MTRLVWRRGIRRAAALALAAPVAAFTVIASTGTASADTKITVKYPVKGSTHLTAPNATAKLGPGKLRATLDLTTGALTATLTLPAATVSFKQLGLIPVTATTEFINNGPTTGQADLGTGAVTTTSKITLKVTSLTVAGLPVPVGDSCESESPAIIKVVSQKGFSVVSGGKLAGTYTIPPFAHCGLVTPLLNVTVPGPGNKITLKLGKAKRV